MLENIEEILNRMIFNQNQIKKFLISFSDSLDLLNDEKAVNDFLFNINFGCAIELKLFTNETAKKLLCDNVNFINSFNLAEKYFDRRRLLFKWIFQENSYIEKLWDDFLMLIENDLKRIKLISFNNEGEILEERLIKLNDNFSHLVEENMFFCRKIVLKIEDQLEFEPKKEKEMLETFIQLNSLIKKCLNREF